MEAKSFLEHSSSLPPPPRRARIRTLGQREDRYETLSTRARVIPELYPHWITVPVQWPNVNSVQGGLVLAGSIKALFLLPVSAPPSQPFYIIVCSKYIFNELYMYIHFAICYKITGPNDSVHMYSYTCIK